MLYFQRRIDGWRNARAKIGENIILPGGDWAVSEDRRLGSIQRYLRAFVYKDKDLGCYYYKGTMNMNPTEYMQWTQATYLTEKKQGM